MSTASRNRKRAISSTADLGRLRRMSESEILRTSPPELADLPDDFWSDATVVEPVAKLCCAYAQPSPTQGSSLTSRCTRGRGELAAVA